MANRILAAATSTGEKQVASNMLQHIQQAEEQAAQRTAAPSSVQGDRISQTATVNPRPAGTAEQGASPSVPVELKRRGAIAADGPISAVECGNTTEVMINVDLPSGPVTFYTPDLAKVAVSCADSVPEPKLSSCREGKGRTVTLSGSPTPGQEPGVT